MKLIGYSTLCCVIVFAHTADSKVYVLRDYDDEATYIIKSDDESTKHKAIQSSSYKPKRTYKNNVKHAIVHYGRHIYHLDDFDDIKKLRSILNSDPKYISYEYVDFNGLLRTQDPLKDIPWGNIQNLVIFTPSPKLIRCSGRECKENLRKYSDNALREIKKIESTSPLEEWKRKNMPFGKTKRFKIVDNRHTSDASSKPKRIVVSSEEEDRKRKPKNKPKQKLSSDSDSKEVSSSESKESRESDDSDESKSSRDSTPSSESKSSSDSTEISDSSSESRKKKRKKRKKTIYDRKYSSSEESTEYTTRKPKKYDSHLESLSWEEKWAKIYNTESNSIEKEFSKKMKTNRKKPPDETKRKTFNKEDIILQGNNIYNANDIDFDKDQRRRLPHFLPKRFHWDASEIHDLGYYWFNGPRGRYPEPTLL